MKIYKTGYTHGAAALLAVLMLQANASANITNSTPFTNSFEQYTAGQSIVGTNGWYADDTNVLTVVTNAADIYDNYLSDLPLTNATHNQILVLDGTATNLFTNSTMETYVDMMVQPRRWEEDTPPDVPTNDMRTAIYFNSNGHLVVYASYHNAASNTDHTGWLEMPGYTVGTSQWVRLTVDLLTGIVGGEEWIRVRLDGTRLEHPLGAPIVQSTNNPGQWLQVANTTPDHRLSGLVLSGTGKFDDMQVTYPDPITAVKYTVLLTVNPPGSASAVVGTFQTTDSASVPFKEDAPPYISVGTIPGDGSGYQITNIFHTAGTGPRTSAWHGAFFETFDFYQIETGASNHAYEVFCEAQPQSLTIAGTGLPSTGSPTYNTYTNYLYDQSMNISSTDDSPLSTTTERHSCAWSRTGSDGASGESQGTTVNSTFTLRGTTTHTWNWHTEYSLTAQTKSQHGAYSGTEGNLSVPVAPGRTWYNAGASAEITASDDGNWVFDQWSGATNGTNNPLTLTMAAPVTNLVANFIYVSNGSNRNLTVSSAYGTPTPVTGTTVLVDGTVTNCTMAEQSIPTGVGTQLYCTGWTGTGSLGNGTTTNTGPFVMTADTTVTWNWQLQHRLIIVVTNSGTTAPAAGTNWVSAAGSTTVVATPGGGASFLSWSGTNANDLVNGSQINVYMAAGPRTITAVFSTGSDVTPHGTPYVWLDQFGLTDHDNDDVLDQDSDGLFTWEEYITGTDPTNAASVFVVLDIGEMSGSNRVTFYGTDNGVTLPFGILRSTNLISGDGWLLKGTVDRATDGTNNWWDDDLPGTGIPVFYRPIATNVVE